MQTGMNAKDYVFIIVESQGEKESFVGLQDPGGERFLAVTGEREQGQALLERLPPPAEGVIRRLELIHRTQIVDQASQEGFMVYKVDGRGRVLERLTPLPPVH